MKTFSIILTILLQYAILVTSGYCTDKSKSNNTKDDLYLCPGVACPDIMWNTPLRHDDDTHYKNIKNNYLPTESEHNKNYKEPPFSHDNKYKDNSIDKRK